MSTAEMSSETGAGSCAAASDTAIAQPDMAKAKVQLRSLVYPSFGQARFGNRMAISMHDRCGGSITQRPRGATGLAREHLGTADRTSTRVNYRHTWADSMEV